MKSKQIVIALDIDDVLNSYDDHVKINQFFDDFVKLNNDKKLSRNDLWKIIINNHAIKTDNYRLVINAIPNILFYINDKNDILGYVNKDKLNLLHDFIENLFNKNNEVEIHVLGISSWFYPKNEFQSENQKIFEFLGFGSKGTGVITEVAKYTNGVGAKRKQATIDYVNQIQSKSGFSDKTVIVYLDDIEISLTNDDEILNGHCGYFLIAPVIQDKHYGDYENSFEKVMEKINVILDNQDGELNHNGKCKTFVFN